MMILLDNGSIVETEHGIGEVHVGQMVVGKLLDENGNIMYDSGTVVEILSSDE